MKKIILSVLALISCFSLSSCSNEEKPLKTIQLKENQTLRIDKYEFGFSYVNCYYCKYGDADDYTEELVWRNAKIQNLPFSYTTIILKVYSNSLTISVDFNTEKINSLIEKYNSGPINTSSYAVEGEKIDLYSQENTNSTVIGRGILTDSKTSTFIYSPESFDYSDYTLTFNANTTPYELKEVSK